MSEFKLEKRDQVGANDPPENPYLAELQEANQALADEQVQLEMDAAKLPAVVNSDADVSAITAWVVRARGLAQRVETKRVADKEPLLAKTRTLDGFFNGIRTHLRGRADAIEDRSAPYLKAKRDREQAEANARAQAAAAEAQRQRDEAEAARRAEAQAKADAEAEQERLRVAAAEAAAQQTTAQLQAEADEGAPIEIDFAAAAEANRAEEASRSAELAVQQAQRDADRAEENASNAQRVADQAERAAANPLKLGRTAGAGGSANVRTVWEARIDSWQLLGATLGPLVHFLSRTAVEDAVRKAGQASIRPDIPGVSYHSKDEVRTTAARKP